MYSRQGGSTLRGIAKPGKIVWSRIWINSPSGDGSRLCMSLERADVIRLPQEKVERHENKTIV